MARIRREDDGGDAHCVKFPSLYRQHLLPSPFLSSRVQPGRSDFKTMGKIVSRFCIANGFGIEQASIEALLPAEPTPRAET